MIDAAKSVCLICQGKPEAAFNDSQLLCGGHKIDLHAFACRIKFKRKTGSAKVSNSQDDGLIGTIECRLEQYPEWVKLFDISSLEMAFSMEK
jgi:hypothetical protein